MRTTKKIFALLLALLMMLALFASCKRNPDKSRTLYAVYDEDKYVYADDTDFTDFLWTNIYYHALENGGGQLSSDEYREMIERSLKSTILMRVLEKKFKKLGYSVDEDEVKLAAAADAERFEKNYEGGYSKFLKEWNLSENALMMVNKYKAMLEIVAEKLSDYKPVSEEEAYAYYTDPSNSFSYYEPPSYVLYNLVLQVSDPADNDKKAETLADAMTYIGRLNSGESWETVKNAAFIKYNAENGLAYSYFLTGKENISLLDFAKITDLDAKIAEIDADFKNENNVSFSEMFPDGFDAYVEANSLKKGSEEYEKAFEKFYNYSAAVYIAQYHYIISTAWKDGTTYSEPLYHPGFGCYVVVTFDKVKEEASFTPFEDVKDDIINKLESGRKIDSRDKYLDSLYEELNVEFKYTV